MKYIIKDNSPLIKIDEETLDIDILSTQREAISRIYMIDEPGVLTTEDGDINVKNGDIIVRFYEQKFPKKVIVVKSKDWKNNLKTYEAILQEEKEAWAIEKSRNSEPCMNDACDSCEAC